MWRIARLVAAILFASLVTTPPALAEDVTARGAVVFARCSGCHSNKAGENGVGPSLAAVIGRKAGTLPGFNYSPALRGLSTVWTPETLDLFLKSPTKLAPGTQMVMSLPRPNDRLAVIAYLAALPPSK